MPYQLIPQANGTILTSYGDSVTVMATRPSAAYDGVTTQADASSTQLASSAGVAGTGKDWGAGVTHAVTQAIFYPTSDADFYAGGTTGTVSLNVDESADNITWSNIGSYGPVASNTFGNGPANKITVTCTGSQKRYVRGTLGSNGTNNRRVAEMEFYENTPLPPQTFMSEEVCLEKITAIGY